jgi:hypothetical protein
VRGWCCARDSFFRKDDADTMASVDRVVAALEEWRSFLEDLARSFARLRQSTASLPLGEALERAAGQLLPAVVERTGAEDAWYATFEQMLGLVSRGGGGRSRDAPERAPPDRVGALPQLDCARPGDRRETCGEIGRAVAHAMTAPTVARDALAAWRAVRGSAFSNPPRQGEHERIRIDGHLLYINKVERARDPERAERMTAALNAARESARRDAPLTLESLSDWQAFVIAGPAPFRTRDAFAKGGRERYPFDGGTRAAFAAALADANDARVPVSVRAARVYLDVCFFHPFEDGNARAARLALDHVLTRARLALHAVEPLFLVARAPADEQGARSLAYLVDYFMGPTV